MRRRLKILCLVGALVFLTGGLGVVQTSEAETVEELQAELAQKRKNLKQAEERIERFKEEIQEKKQEAKTLEDQIEIIEDNITQVRLSIDQTIAEIEKTDLEINTVEAEVKQKQAEVDHQKDLLSEYIRSLYSLKQQSTVTVFLKYDTFSEAMTETTTVRQLQERSHNALQSIKELKIELERKHNDLIDFQETLDRLRLRQERQQATLVANRHSKTSILDATKEQESQYQDLLEQTKEAHQSAEAEIAQIDEIIREKLKAQGVNNLPSVGIMAWPIEASFGISCGFHCGGYPYQYLIGPHSGVDLPAYVGTPIQAPSDGYVARTHNANGPGYSYIMLVHGGGVSTVFGHVSGFAVSEGQMVTRGTIIGYTGGAPGTNGAGLSTGPHLHFEVRLNNHAVDPMGFL